MRQFYTPKSNVILFLGKPCSFKYTKTNCSFYFWQIAIIIIIDSFLVWNRRLTRQMYSINFVLRIFQYINFNNVKSDNFHNSNFISHMCEQQSHSFTTSVSIHVSVNFSRGHKAVSDTLISMAFEFHKRCTIKDKGRLRRLAVNNSKCCVNNLHLLFLSCEYYLSRPAMDRL